MAQSVIAQILGVPNPDAEDMADMADMADMQMSSSLTSLARRLDVAIARRGSTTPIGAGSDGPLTHPGRSTIAWNNFLASISERGIRP